MQAASRWEQRWGAPLLAAGLALLAGQLLLRAWIAEDAYITYRAVDNWVHGYGLRWNVDERVQAFTHPLWALLHAPLRVVLGSLPTASLALSVACLAGLVAVLWRSLRLDALRFLLAVVVPLLVSHCFSDYAISGLETPLSALLFAAFAALALQRPQHPPWLALGLVFSLALVNRLDAVVCLAPAALVLAAANRRSIDWRALALGAVPLLLWEAFSLFYYGFLVPNTKYAKLDTGIAASDLARQGGAYLFDFARSDPAAASLLVLTLWLAGRAARRAAAGGPRPRRLHDAVLAGFGVGLALHGLYVVTIGGDFMRGRLFAGPLVLAPLLLGDAARSAPLGRLAALAAGLLAAWGLAVAHRAGVSAEDSMWSGIADEHAMFAAHTALLDPRRTGTPEQHPWAQSGLRERAVAAGSGVPHVVTRGTVGLLGYYAGPGVIVVDNIGLGDPLLARLPVNDPRHWRVGHFWRIPPPGYEYARATGDTSRMDPDLARYYEKLRFVVSGPLLSTERLAETVRFNLGAYDTWRDRWLERR